MNNKVVIIAISVIAIVASIVALMMLSGDTDSKQNDAPTKTSQTTTASNDQQQSQLAEGKETTSVTIKDFGYMPADIKVKVGDTVTWTNEDSTQHNVVDMSGSVSGPKSELLAKGESYSFTFTKPGTYNYNCTPHPQMTGKVTVVE